MIDAQKLAEILHHYIIDSFFNATHGKTKQNKINISIERIHEKLKGIKEVVNFFKNSNSDNGRKKTRKNYTLTKMDDIQKKLYEIYKISDYSSI